jgi:hypothetical protein
MWKYAANVNGWIYESQVTTSTKQTYLIIYMNLLKLKCLLLYIKEWLVYWFGHRLKLRYLVIIPHLMTVYFSVEIVNDSSKLIYILDQLSVNPVFRSIRVDLAHTTSPNVYSSSSSPNNSSISIASSVFSRTLLHLAL